MNIIQLQEQYLNHSLIDSEDAVLIVRHWSDDEPWMRCVKRGCAGSDQKENALCLKLECEDNQIFATDSYFVGLDWIEEGELAVQVNPKMNDGFEIDYVRMLNEALSEPANFDHLEDLIHIDFGKPSILVSQQQDLLSIFLITEYLKSVQCIVRKGLKKSYYEVTDNLQNKVKGRIMMSQNIRQNLVRGQITHNVCKYQIYDIDSPENRILKKALKFCERQLETYSHSIDTKSLQDTVRRAQPYFSRVGDEVDVRTLKTFKCNSFFKEYHRALEFAMLLLKRYSYNITLTGTKLIPTPPFWIDMSKLFELYVFQKLKQVFKTPDDVKYHVKKHGQELDYLLQGKNWNHVPYVIDAKYKPRYKKTGGISKEDAREVAGYARLSAIYHELGLDEDSTLPIKCLIIYPDQDANEYFTFSDQLEPSFDKIAGYVRMYKIGIRLPVIQNP